jgi:hypothetical protein
MTPMDYLRRRDREVRDSLRTDAKGLVERTDQRWGLSRRIRTSPRISLAVGALAGALLGRLVPRGPVAAASLGVWRGGSTVLGAVIRGLFRAD